MVSTMEYPSGGASQEIQDDLVKVRKPFEKLTEKSYRLTKIQSFTVIRRVKLESTYFSPLSRSDGYRLKDSHFHMGLRPSRLALAAMLKVPKPTSVILSPLASHNGGGDQ